MRRNFPHFPEKANGEEMGFYNSSTNKLDQSVKNFMTKESGYVLIGWILKGLILYSLPTSFACFEAFWEVGENCRVLPSAVLDLKV